ncbi:hypothetical protein ACFTQL_09320 [Peribacillus butanolivorans]|uniref:hypothetical protein n=1 Tax=Peribacillus butanolivorans TaxID=421767 RepID=UPI003637D3AC
MPTKIIMNSGKEYMIDENAEYVIESFFSENKMPMGNGSITVLRNTFITINNDKTIFINPSHVSSVETLD